MEVLERDASNVVIIPGDGVSLYPESLLVEAALVGEDPRLVSEMSLLLVVAMLLQGDVCSIREEVMLHTPKCS